MMINGSTATFWEVLTIQGEHPTGTQEPTNSSSDWNSGDRNGPITAVKK